MRIRIASVLILFFQAALSYGQIRRVATAPVEQKGSPDILFSSESHDFQAVAPGSPVTYTFQFRNTGDEPLTVTSANGSCSCLQIDWSKEQIRPGGSGFVKLTFNSLIAGNFNKQIVVSSNAKSRMKTLMVRGEVRLPVAPAAIAQKTPAPTPAGPVTTPPQSPRSPAPAPSEPKPSLVKPTPAESSKNK